MDEVAEVTGFDRGHAARPLRNRDIYLLVLFVSYGVVCEEC